MKKEELVEKAYAIAKEQYAELGVDTEQVLKDMEKVVISLHCWQTDDVGGFETPDSVLSGGGIQATGNYPGKARSIQDVRQDMEKALSMLPGKHRLNIHAMYGDFKGKKVDRDEVSVKDFQSWIDWCKENDLGMDFNGTFFSHPKADTGFTLSSKDESIRKFWVNHLKQCRSIAAEAGKQLGTPSINNTWIPDGSKDIPVDRNGHRALLTKSLDEGMEKEYPKEHMMDAVESKLFGIGAEAMTVGSHDFYLGYAISRGKMICLDNGHFHPSEQVGDKISACLQFIDQLLLHVTRPMRWDSDHVVTLNDDVQMIASEIVRGNFLDRIKIGLDFFDASINRIGAYVIGTRAAKKAFMQAMLEPKSKLKEYEESGMFFERLATLEEMKSKLFGAVWDYYCLKEGVAVGDDFISEIQQYEKEVLSKR